MALDHQGEITYPSGPDKVYGHQEQPTIRSLLKNILRPVSIVIKCILGGIFWNGNLSSISKLCVKLFYVGILHDNPVFAVRSQYCSQHCILDTIEWIILCTGLEKISEMTSNIIGISTHKQSCRKASALLFLKEKSLQYFEEDLEIVKMLNLILGLFNCSLFCFATVVDAF